MRSMAMGGSAPSFMAKMSRQHVLLILHTVVVSTCILNWKAARI